ncbi:hypothetical protein Pyn_31612 [Prunus yedoensis var. nudiflora]|uniref:Pectin acetylesterase n=1 Tax=Prunus yedoensis var. nudiflora TaxID=2094558 RepID=A0A314UFP8_PRUYE|nr:hypothetical protein Pyn_31612 [Prunus yedoensis var. nudiflora]
MKLWWVGIVISLVFSKWVNGFVEHSLNETELSFLEAYGESKVGANYLMVGLTLIPGAAAKRAVCLDGTLPGYHLHRGYGLGANSWLIQLEGGGWCNSIRNCVYRKTTRRGSSRFMEKNIAFTGILSNKAEENPGFSLKLNANLSKTILASTFFWFCVDPHLIIYGIADFFNWNRVKLRYCDGASFTGDGEDKARQLQFRGQRIWLSAMEDLKSKGMRYAKQGVQHNLPRFCTNHLDPTSCFFPQNLIANIQTPLFILNAAYDSWQIQSSLAPASADPAGFWHECRLNHAKCTPSQINFLQGFRNQMLNAVKRFSMSNKNGLFINSCFAHCQTERQDTWFADNSPVIGKKAIAIAVGDWYFDRTSVKAVDCPYPCDNSCHNLVFQRAN